MNESYFKINYLINHYNANLVRIIFYIHICVQYEKLGSTTKKFSCVLVNLAR